jgi:hypothetical protein
MTTVLSLGIPSSSTTSRRVASEMHATRSPSRASRFFSSPRASPSEKSCGSFPPSCHESSPRASPVHRSADRNTAGRRSSSCGTRRDKTVARSAATARCRHAPPSGASASPPAASRRLAETPAAWSFASPGGVARAAISSRRKSRNRRRRYTTRTDRVAGCDLLGPHLVFAAARTVSAGTWARSSFSDCPRPANRSSSGVSDSCLNPGHPRPAAPQARPGRLRVC